MSLEVYYVDMYDYFLSYNCLRVGQWLVLFDSSVDPGGFRQGSQVSSHSP